MYEVIGRRQTGQGHVGRLAPPLTTPMLPICMVGNGISDEYHVIRHVMNLEAVNTYEGREERTLYL